MTTSEEAAGPRRYQVSFECSEDQVATVIGTIIKQVEVPKMEPAAQPGLSRVSFICHLDQLPPIVGAVVGVADNLVVRPYTPEIPAAVRQFMPKPRPVVETRHVEIKKIPMQVRRRRVIGGAKPSETASGQVILSVLNRKPTGVTHTPEFTDAMMEQGFQPNSAGNALNGLIKEGKVVRVGYAAYRLATPEEELVHRQKQLGVQGAPSTEPVDEVSSGS